MPILNFEKGKNQCNLTAQSGAASTQLGSSVNDGWLRMYLQFTIQQQLEMASACG
jgi:hypothetical protein